MPFLSLFCYSILKSGIILILLACTLYGDSEFTTDIWFNVDCPVTAEAWC